MTARSIAHRERRAGGDRRQSHFAFRFPDRRLGYPRRVAYASPRRLAYLQMLRRYGDNASMVAAALVTFVALNAVDIFATLRAIDMGATEANPVVAFLLGNYPGFAVILKLSVGVVVSVAIWLLRRYRRALESSLLLLAIFTLLTAYHGLLLAAAG